MKAINIFFILIILCSCNNNKNEDINSGNKGQTVPSESVEVATDSTCRPRFFRRCTLSTPAPAPIPVISTPVKVIPEPIYKLSYHANNAETGLVPVDSSSYRANDSALVFGNVNNLSRTNYIFRSWNTQASGSGLAYRGNDAFSINQDTTLYADWASKYTTRIGSSTRTHSTNKSISFTNKIYTVGKAHNNLNGLNTTGLYDGFIMKTDDQGSLIWTKLIGATSATTEITSIAITSSEDILVVGNTTGSISPYTKTGGTDSFIAKFDNSGNLLFLKQFGYVNTSLTCKNIFLDPSGDFYTLSSITRLAVGASVEGTTLGLGDGILINKLDNLGNIISSNYIGQAGSITLKDAFFQDNSFFIVGDTLHDLNTNQNHYVNKAYFGKWNLQGNLVYFVFLNTNEESSLSGITKDSSNNIYVTGSSSSNYFGLTKIGMVDLLVAKYDSLGNNLWGKLIGVTSKYTYGVAIAELNKEIHVAAYTDGTHTSQSKTGLYEGVLFKINKSSGAHSPVKQIGGESGSSYVHIKSIYEVNNIVTTTAEVYGGSFQGSVEVGDRDILITNIFN